ncbi:hypothetical protein CON01_24665 [Bacillus thuringiensis]|uniref:Uncharacterized protein n=1 Tax=Bacillus thuringiensis TaxID=1428 RepID=A0A9X6TW75_BACTU|nr:MULTISPECIES: hypothetical protein [Bacillus cereus group]MBG9863517.1 hypothetical protein [Bacillus cereus]MBG9878606.1 hypothetical protein [Bacillus tropicus]MBG9921727.1 hypothetical protein [Bacillus tropicus]MBJ8353608.1 hypothetical protein [Bacillus mycoides]MED2902786.1 hypothetical protein [Bacillus tropicus]
MGRTNKEERQKVFGLRTDNMSEKVYSHLDKKARTKQLASYLIKLVEQDLKGQEPFDAKEELIEVSKNQDYMMKAIEQLTRKISTIQVAPAPSVVMSNQENNNTSLENDLLKDVGKSGQLITSKVVTGSLDDEDLEDPDF